MLVWRSIITFPRLTTPGSSAVAKCSWTETVWWSWSGHVTGEGRMGGKSAAKVFFLFCFTTSAEKALHFGPNTASQPGHSKAIPRLEGCPALTRNALPKGSPSPSHSTGSIYLTLLISTAYGVPDGLLLLLEIPPHRAFSRAGVRIHSSSTYHHLLYLPRDRSGRSQLKRLIWPRLRHFLHRASFVQTRPSDTAL